MMVSPLAVFVANILWGAVGVMVLVIAIGAFWLISGGGGRMPVSQEAHVSVPLGTGQHASPKEELSQMGIRRDENSFRSAINHNDTRLVSLFLRTGMNWKLSWTEEAIVAEHNDVLDLLLRYRGQMDEQSSCQRFIATLSHELTKRKTLTSLAANYLRAFCTAPVEVQRQRDDMEQAQLRYDAVPSDEHRQWADIQRIIYEAIKAP